MTFFASKRAISKGRAREIHSYLPLDFSILAEKLENIFNSAQLTAYIRYVFL